MLENLVLLLMVLDVVLVLDVNEPYLFLVLDVIEPWLVLVQMI